VRTGYTVSTHQFGKGKLREEVGGPVEQKCNPGRKKG